MITWWFLSTRDICILCIRQSTLARPEWKGDTFRDCTNGLAAAVGAMTTSDTTATVSTMMQSSRLQYILALDD